MRRDLLETVDAGNRQDTGLAMDFELVAVARMDFLAHSEAIEKPLNNRAKPDDEHVVPPIRRIQAGGQ